MIDVALLVRAEWAHGHWEKVKGSCLTCFSGWLM